MCYRLPSLIAIHLLIVPNVYYFLEDVSGYMQQVLVLSVLP